MEPAIRNAITRIDVMEKGQSTSRGTGFLVADGLVLTALHVVADRRETVLTPIRGEIELTFPTVSAKATIHEDYWDRLADWVLLRCDSLAGIRPLPLAELRDDGCGWETYGFPDANPQDGMENSGEVSNRRGTLEGNPVYQLFSREASAGQGEPVKGLSGGPVIVKDAAVGLLRFALIKDRQTVAGTLYACPITSVLKKADKVLPLPDPCFGLPGLPRQPLPTEPFRHLAWFTAKEAEVFFGRNHEIRQVYDLLTKDDAPPVLLLYGQAGVGKSSFLEAGLFPRLQWYHEVSCLRRDPHSTLLKTLRESLNPPSAADTLALAWQAVEKKSGKPLVVFFDQIEELYTHPQADAADELGEFGTEIAKLFDGTVPVRGKLVLSFRKEWFPEVQKQMEAGKIRYDKVFLEPLDRDAAIEAIGGLTGTDRLREFYRLKIQPGLDEAIAGDLLGDRDSPLAPTLQILLTKMWRRAVAVSRHAPEETLEDYEALKKEGLLLGDFLDQQLEALRAIHAEWVDSALALDVLAFHTTPLLTARQCGREQLLATYQHHRAEELEELMQAMQQLFLLSDPSGDVERRITRLCHDTLAPLVRQRFDRSDKPGQRARRTIESRTADWDGSDSNALDGPSLAVVDAGMNGMRVLDKREQDLVAASRRKRTRDTRTSRIAKIAWTVVAILIVGLSISASVGYVRARQQKKLSDLRLKAANGQVLLPRDPLSALLQVIATTQESLESQKTVLPGVQFALSSAMVGALEMVRVDGSMGKAPLAMTPDGLTLARPSIEKAGEMANLVVKFWDVRGAETGSFRQSLPRGSSEEIWSVAFSPDGDLLAVGGQGLFVWDRRRQTVSGADSFGGVGHDREVKAMAFSPDGKYLLNAELDGRVRVWTLDGHEVATIPAPRGRMLRQGVWALATAKGPKGETLIATGGGDGYARLWRLEGERLSLVNEFNTGNIVWCLDLSVRRNQPLLATGDDSGGVRVWNEKGAASNPFDLPQPVVAIAIQPGSDVIAAAGEDGTVQFLAMNLPRLRSIQTAPAFQGLANFTHPVTFLPDGGALVVGTTDGFRLLDASLLGGSRRVAAFDAFQNGDSDRIAGAGFLRGGAVAAGTRAGDLLLWYPAQKAVRRVEHLPGRELQGLACNRQGTMIAGVGTSRIHLYDSDGSKIGELEGDGSQALGPALFSPDGRSLAANGPSGIDIWDVASRTHRASIPAKGGYSAIAFTAGSDLVAGATPATREVQFFHLDGSPAQTVPLDVQSDISSMAFRPDGRGFVTGEQNALFQRWTMTGQAIEPTNPPGPSHTLYPWIAVDSHSQIVFATDQTGPGIGTYPVDPKSVVELTAGFGMPIQIQTAALSPEEDAIVTVDDTGVRVWPANWQAFLRESCQRLRNNGVWNQPARAADLKAVDVQRAQALCKEQVWK